MSSDARGASRDADDLQAADSDRVRSALKTGSRAHSRALTRGAGDADAAASIGHARAPISILIPIKYVDDDTTRVVPSCVIN